MVAGRRPFVIDTNCFVDASLAERDGLVLSSVRRSFVFDILIAWSCREVGATLVSRNQTDVDRIAKVFGFDFTAPYPG